MKMEMLAQTELIINIGWTLLHSIWQISLVSIGLLVILRLLRNHSPNLRYTVAVIALAGAFVLPVITFVQITTQASTTLITAGSGNDTLRTRSGNAGGAGNPVLAEPGEGATAAHPANAGTLFSDLEARISRALPQLLPLAVFAWLLGVVLFSLRMSGGFWQLRRYRTDAADELESDWKAVFVRLVDSTGVRQKVDLVRSHLVETPIAIGILRPVVVIPASLFLQISPRELETIIAHELIHIRRYDPLVNIVQCLIETVLFYHPGVWWISAQVRREREFAADLAVTDLFEDSHVMYARALANLEEIRLRTNQQMPRYVTAANGGNFVQRIQRILKIKTEASIASSAWTAGLALLLTSAFLLALFSFSSSEVVNAQQRPGPRKLAIGFVSIPPLDRTANPPKDGDATARLLIQKLKEYKVPATGFLMGGMISNGDKLYPVRANIARLWIDAGLEVGLGGFRHLSLYNTPADEYIANIEKNEGVAKKLIGEMGLPPRYFSYPYLNTGKTEDRSRVESWLASRGYTPVKYTIDNQEWMYSFAYDMARNDNDVNTMKEIRESYLSYMSKMFDHFEAYSIEMFGRDIPQTMVLTPSGLTAHTMDDLLAMAVKRGYTFVSIDEAQSDPAYKTAENFDGDSGISWFERWTMAKGQKLRHEPDVDRFVMRSWNERKAPWK